jgi:Fic family protein
MYSPNVTLTNLILKYIVNIELNNEKIKNTPLPYKSRQELYEKIHAEDMHALSEMLNIPLGYAKALDIQRGRVDSDKYKIFSNYRSTQEFIKSYKSTNFIPISSELICHLNKLLLNGILEPWEAGKFRKFSEQPNEIYDNWYKYKQYYPKRIGEKYFNEFSTWLYSDRNNYSKLIQASLLIYEFIDNAPLFAGNQITSLLTLTCILKEFGYNPNNTFCPAKGISMISDDIPQIFKMSKEQKDQTLFTEGILYVLSLESTRLKQMYESSFEKTTKKKAESEENLNDRQLKILEYLQKNKKIDRTTCTKLMGVSFMTAYRDLVELVQSGYLDKKGRNKNTYYTLKEKESDEKSSKKLIKDTN